MDQEKVVLDLRDVSDFCGRLSGDVSGIPSAMLFNVDERGNLD
jgi:hypothetical protein